MKRLTDHISSQYLEAANRLKPRRKARTITAFVESYDDVFFWRSVLQEFENDELRFEVMLPSRNTLGKGKKLVLNNKLGPFMIACVDADYDYLMQGRTEVSKFMLENPYVFHTYAYAIENLQCYAPALHTACVMATLNDRPVLNFEVFVEEFSVIVWPLLVWSIWCYRNDEFKRFSIYDLADTLMIRDVNVYHPEQTLEYIRRQTNKRVAWCQRTFPKAKGGIKPLEEELLALGLTPETTYLYIQGHGLFDNVILPLVGPVCTLLRRERENEIKRLACHETQRQNELSCYQHSVSPVDAMLKKGTAFRQSDVFQRLREDLQRFVNQSANPES